MPKVKAITTYKMCSGEMEAIETIDFFYEDEYDYQAETIEVDEVTFLALIKFSEESGKKLHIPDEQ